MNFVQALAQIAGWAINKARYVKGLKISIEVLKTMKEKQIYSKHFNVILGYLKQADDLRVAV